MDNQFTKETLCSNVALCMRYDFQGSQYVKSSLSNGNHKYSVVPRSQYDVGSIMHYASDEQSNNRCKHGTLNECILVKYIENNPAKGVEKIPVNTKVTSRDAIWVRMFYPWKPEVMTGSTDGTNGDAEFLVIDGKKDIMD
jgi:hypothetical protein